MEFLNTLPVWLLALCIFGFRIADVTLGTLRTISVVEGRVPLSVALGFFEVLIWMTAVSQVITGLGQSGLLLVSYAGGFAAGNAVGILLERRIALGTVVVRLISSRAGRAIANSLRGNGWRLTTFRGEGRDGPVTLLYLTCPRRELNGILERAREVDPHVFWAVESVRDQGRDPLVADPMPHLAGWRAAFKMR